MLSAAMVVATATAASPPAHASTQYCISGVGQACADLAEGNALIQALQEKSAANKEQHERDARNAYYMKNYPDWFQSVGQTLIKKESDGTFLVVSDDELRTLQRSNLLTLEIPRSKKNVVDYTQKPILVLKRQGEGSVVVAAREPAAALTPSSAASSLLLPPNDP
ncbi:hypothetical protein ACA910_013771 [Epithemia clementina (nom. ined.)]